MLLQVINDIQLSNWVNTIVLGILGVLLFRILSKIEKKQEEHDERISHVETRVAVIDDRKDKSKDTLDQILFKIEQIKAMQ